MGRREGEKGRRSHLPFDALTVRGFFPFSFSAAAATSSQRRRMNASKTGYELEVALSTSMILK